MLKLQDFSRQQGVSDRQIQRLLKKYEKELEGQFERKGPNGTWLTDEACDFLRGKMKQQPVAVLEADPRVEQLETRVRELEDKLDKKEQMLTIAQEQVQRAYERTELLQGKVDEIKQIEAAAELQERELKLKDKELALVEERANDLQAQLDRLASAGYRERKKLLKELKKQRKNKE